MQTWTEFLIAFGGWLAGMPLAYRVAWVRAETRRRRAAPPVPVPECTCGGGYAGCGGGTGYSGDDHSRLCPQVLALRRRLMAETVPAWTVVLPTGAAATAGFGWLAAHDTSADALFTVLAVTVGTAVLLGFMLTGANDIRMPAPRTGGLWHPVWAALLWPPLALGVVTAGAVGVRAAAGVGTAVARGVRAWMHPDIKVPDREYIARLEKETST